MIKGFYSYAALSLSALTPSLISDSAFLEALAYSLARLFSIAAFFYLTDTLEPVNYRLVVKKLTFVETCFFMNIWFTWGLNSDSLYSVA
ncbi:MAG: hypothetical protein N2376_04220 [Clostridia bacterium]|nr:hypothetical protein [Clostridia bacterium]